MTLYDYACSTCTSDSPHQGGVLPEIPPISPSLNAGKWKVDTAGRCMMHLIVGQNFQPIGRTTYSQLRVYIYTGIYIFFEKFEKSWIHYKGNAMLGERVYIFFLRNFKSLTSCTGIYFYPVGVSERPLAHGADPHVVNRVQTTLLVHQGFAVRLCGVSVSSVWDWW